MEQKKNDETKNKKNKLKKYFNKLRSQIRFDKNNKKHITFLLIFCVLIGMVSALFVNRFNRGQNIDLSLEPAPVIPREEHTFPPDILEDITQPITEDIEEAPERTEKVQENEREEIEETELEEDVVTEPVLPVMETEQEEIRLLQPVSGEIIRNRGWYYHSVFNDWRFLEGITIDSTAGNIVMAADFAEVSEVVEDDYKGLVVKLNHEDVWETIYGHLAEAAVKPGDTVARGQEIGRVGQSGLAVENPKLYFELKNKNGYVNPAEFFE